MPFLFAFYLFINYYPTKASDASQNFGDYCNIQTTVLQNATALRLFKQINANLPRDLSAHRVLSSIDDFNKCLSIDERFNDTNIQGKYCSISVTIPNPLNLRRIQYMPDIATLTRAEEFQKSRQPYRFPVLKDCPSSIFKAIPRWKKLTKKVHLGVCIPKVCSSEGALQFVLNNRPFMYEDQILEDFGFDDNKCRMLQPTQLTVADYIAIFVFTVILVLTTASTIYDINHQMIKKLDSKPNRVYSSFSVYTNTRRLVDSTSRISSDTVLCVNGIRAISIAWEIAGHVNRNILSILDNQWSDTRHYLYETEHYVVDTFLLLSGFFVVYTNVKKYTAASFVKNIPKYYLNRILRLYPILCALLLLDVTIYKHLEEYYDIAQDDGKLDNSCTDLWWIVLLFINNIVFTCDRIHGFFKWCLFQSWYLAVDMQLYIISPLIMIWLFGKKKVAWTALTTTLVISLTACTILAFLWNFPFLINSYLLPYNDDEIWIFYYTNTLYRSPPYFIGMMLAYYMHTLRKKKIYLSKFLVFFLWSLIILIFMWSFYITKQMIYTYNQTVNNLLGAYQRSIWSTGVALVIFTCHCGYGGPVNWLLSLNMWKLLSRLNYAMFLCQLQITLIILMVNRKVGQVNPSIWIDLQQFACAYIITFIISFALVVLIEMPVINLQAIIQGPRKREVFEEKNSPRYI